MIKRNGWEEIRPLGEGGQSKVYLVRSPRRAGERADCLKRFRPAMDRDDRAQVAEAIWTYARPDGPSELGALKVFKIPPKHAAGPLQRALTAGEREAVERLGNEVASLTSNNAGMPKLLDHNVQERWIVTEFFPHGTLEDNRPTYRGNARLALKAFRSLVETVALLHKDGRIHRDIKPANVFVKTTDELILGDFGIVYAPSAAERVTTTGERVEPRDYMPPWANLGTRLEEVDERFDIYMLGKLLWSMVDGRLLLPREYHKDPDFDLTKSFPDEPSMHLVNQILDNCVVERPDRCLASAADLLLIVSTILRVIERGGQSVKDGVQRFCRVCGSGVYQPVLRDKHTPARSIALHVPRRSESYELLVQAFACDKCGHVQFFQSSSDAA